MARNDFSTTLQSTNEIEITVTGRTSRSTHFQPRLVRPGRRKALSGPSEGIRERLVQKYAQDTDNPLGRQRGGVHCERHTDHRRRQGAQCRQEVPRQVRRGAGEGLLLEARRCRRNPLKMRCQLGSGIIQVNNELIREKSTDL